MSRRSLTRSTFLLLPLFAITVAPVDAVAATRLVRMIDVDFKPRTMRANMGDVVKWRNDGQIFHTTTSKKPYVSSWDKGLNPGRTWSKRFNFAGTYRYYCRPHVNKDKTQGMLGTVKVPTKASPKTGGNATKFRIYIANTVPPDAWVMQVQRRVNNGAWKMFKDRIAKRYFTYRSGTDGKHRFRARLVKRNGAVKHLWSPVVGITIR